MVKSKGSGTPGDVEGDVVGSNRDHTATVDNAVRRSDDDHGTRVLDTQEPVAKTATPLRSGTGGLHLGVERSIHSGT